MEDSFERDRNGFIILKRKYSELYEKVTYTTSLPVIINKIYEYDIHSANISAFRDSGKFADSMIDKLESLPKADREKAVGKMIRRNKDIYKIISKGIKHAKKMLFSANGITDGEIVSIKNDAVFIAGRTLKETTFGPYEFRLKNTYAMYIKIEGNEYYYDKRHKRIDIKGVNDTVLSDQDHKEGILIFLQKVFDYIILDQRDELRKYLISFVSEYKSKTLPHQYYKELNDSNIYRTQIEVSGFSYNMSEMGDSLLSIVNGIYNYTKIILPIIRLYM